MTPQVATEATAETETPTAPTAVTRDVERPTRKQVITAIVAQIGCTRQQAHHTVNMLSRAVAWCRQHPGVHYYIPQIDLDRCHDVFAMLIPDDTPDVLPGSARALVNRHLLKGNELNIMHGSRWRHHRTHCTVQVTINIV